MSDQPENSNPHKDRRLWWVAVLMLFPLGLGYIYVGRPWRFAIFTVFALLCLFIPYHTLWNWLFHPVVFWAYILAVVAFSLAFAVDVTVIAMKQTRHTLRWPQRRKLYAVSLVIVAVVALTPGILETVFHNIDTAIFMLDD